MNVIKTPAQFHRWRRSLSPKISVGFVPTMGALHEGHTSLVKKSIRENDRTVVSIFVNPTQFGPKEDFKAYPRPWKKDREALRKLGVDVLFFPTAADLYPAGAPTWVEVTSFPPTLCAAPTSRGFQHFRGVTTVVAKLFAIVQPTRAYFGLKDFQQVRFIERMNDDLKFGIDIVCCATVRERDGLAMSSRNAYLKPTERQLAPVLYRSLLWGAKLLRSRPRMRPSETLKRVRSSLSSLPGLKIEYIELVNADTLERIRLRSFPVLLAAAVRLGTTRLIDNILISHA